MMRVGRDLPFAARPLPGPRTAPNMPATFPLSEFAI